MTVQVRLFAAYREAAGRSRMEVSLPRDARVADLTRKINGELGRLDLSQGLVAVNQEYVRGDERLSQGDEVALIPPVSGGA